MNEPNHGTPVYPETLWWRWTAPSNGLASVPVRLMADATSYPPGLGVYTGNTLLGLASQPVTTRTNGMSRITTFNATPGTSYAIALSGLQHDTNSIVSVMGSYRFRLNARPLGLSFPSVGYSTNTNTMAVTINAQARLDNFGVAPSYPLRVLVSAISGQSLRGDIGGLPATNRLEQGAYPPTPLVLTPNEFALVSIGGLVPAPEVPGSSLSATGYGLYAELQEQPFDTNWFTVDQDLVSFGVWPSFDGGVGPGGGVVRLDPGYIGLSPFNPLRRDSVGILGNRLVSESGAHPFAGRAAYALGDIVQFSNSVWSVTPSNRFSISTNGVLRTGSVTSNTPATLTVRYRSSGIYYDASTNIVVSNIIAALGGYRVLSNGEFSFTLNGAPTQGYAFQAATNLPPPTNVWVTLTNITAGTNGALLFTDPNRTNFPRRFYRAVEL